MGSFFKNAELPGAFILVSSFGGNLKIEKDRLVKEMEDDIKENLEVFEYASYRRDRMDFEYKSMVRDEITGDRMVCGQIKNEYAKKSVIFYGYYIESPVAYVFGVCEQRDHLEKIKKVIDGAVASAYLEDEQD